MSPNSHYPDSEPTSLCSFFLMLRAYRKSNYQFYSLWFDSTAIEASTLTITLPIQFGCPNILTKILYIFLLCTSTSRFFKMLYIIHILHREQYRIFRLSKPLNSLYNTTWTFSLSEFSKLSDPDYTWMQSGLFLLTICVFISLDIL